MGSRLLPQAEVLTERENIVSVISMKQLLEAGVHFGHRTRRWHPKMRTFIFTERNGIHIIDLQQTVKNITTAYNAIRDEVASGGVVLFVGTKRQAQETVQEEAIRCGMPYVNQRWLGGMLTNFVTVKKSVDRLNNLNKMFSDDSIKAFPKKEITKLQKEMEKLENVLGGIKNMKSHPSAVFIVDPNRERITVQEAKKLKVPLVAIVDTNCDPDEVDYVIPGNDDAIRAVKLITGRMADAIIEGRQGESFEEAPVVAAAVVEVEEVEADKAEAEAVVEEVTEA